MGGPYCFSQWLDHFTSSLKVHEGSSLSTSTLTLVVVVVLFFVVFFGFFFFCFLGPYLWHTQVPRLEVESQLHLAAYTTATVMLDLSHVCNLYHSSQQ